METTRPTVEVTLTPGKPMQVKVFGIQGSACTQITKPLEAMGKVEMTPTADYYGEVTETVIQATSVNAEGC